MWANWMRHQAELSADLNGLEVLLWVWTFSRLLGELREQAGIGAEEDEDLLEQRRALLAARGEEEEQ